MNLPNCTLCRARVQPGQPVRFTEVGRTEHVECLPIICPVCRKAVQPVDRIGREGERLLHAGCATRRLRGRNDGREP